MAFNLRDLVTPASPPPSFDPARLGDPVATRTEWTPAARGGANFRTHRLVEVNSGRLEFRATTGAIVLYLLFSGMGAAMFAVFVVTEPLRVEGSLNFEMLFPAAIGLVFALVGGGMFRFGTTPIVFDRSRRWFWRGRAEPSDFPGSDEPARSARFDSIHALQIVAERISRRNGSYRSFEFNLVLKDGTRINVVDHGNPESIRRDVATVAAFLGKPVWDAG